MGVVGGISPGALALVPAALLCLAAGIACGPAAGEAGTPWRVEYLARGGREPHQVPALGFAASGAGEATFPQGPGGPLLTTDTSPQADGRFYYRPGWMEEADPAGNVRIEVRVRVLRSTGHLCATSVQLTVDAGQAKLGPLTLGQHGEGYQDFGAESRRVAIGFVTSGAEGEEDEVLLLDPAGPEGGRVLGRFPVPVGVMRTYVLEVRRGATREEDRVLLSIEGSDLAPVSARIADLTPVAASPKSGFVFGHPAGAGTGEAEWERLTLTAARALPTPEATAPGKGPLGIGRRRQLFLDDWLIERMEGLTRRQGVAVKHPANPVLRREHPWEASRCEVYGSAVWDHEGKRLQLFYSAMSVPYHVKMAYAESRDGGSRWARPELGLFEFEGKKTNIVWPGRYMVAGPCVFRDAHDPDPARRYKLFTGDAVVGTPEDKGPQGMEVAFSPDGIRWTPSKRNPVITRFNSDTTQCAFWDENTGQYVAYVRLRSAGGRSVGRTESRDFETWSEPHLVYTPTPDDRTRGWEFYSLSVTPYEGIYVGLVWVFPAVPASADWKADTPVTWPELVASRDGLRWQRVAFGQPFLPLGPAGSFDHRQIRTASSLVVLDDRILLVYAGSPDPHVSAHKFDIGMATLRKDGFTALCADDREGTLLTRPLTFDAGALHVNAAVAPGGSVKAEVLDGRGKPVPGFGISECRPFTGDSTDAPITWQSRKRLPASGKEGLRVRFLLRRAKLYSFRVAPAG